jgi:hypothetical protein
VAYPRGDTKKGLGGYTLVLAMSGKGYDLASFVFSSFSFLAPHHPNPLLPPFENMGQDIICVGIPHAQQCKL